MSRKGENIYKRKDGRWEGRYKKSRKPDGSIYYGYIYGKRYQDVKRRVTQAKAHQALQEPTATNRFTGTLQDWGTYWLETLVAPTVKRSTYSSYESKLLVHVFPTLGTTPLHRLKEPQLQRWVHTLATKVAAGSVQAIVRVLRTCLNEARHHGHLRENPCRQWVLPPVPTRVAEGLEKHQHQALKQVAQAEKHGFPVVLSLETGLRLGEICGLKWTDIDFDQQVLHVNRTLQRVGIRKGQTAIVEGTPKTRHSIRRIPLSPSLSKALKARYAQAKGAYVISEDERPVEPRVVQYRFKKLAKQAKVATATFHTLRHSFATRCLEFGVTIATISALLGHSSIKMTLDVYTHSSRSEERAAITKLATF